MNKVSKKRFLLIALAGTLIFGGWIILSGKLERYIFKPTDSNLPAGTQLSGQRDESDIKITAVDLNIPWAIAELPEGDLLVTERLGKLKRVGSDRQLIEIPGVEHSGEGGLLGLALHPDFAENNKIYLYLTTRTDVGLINRVESYTYKNGGLSEKKTIIDKIPGARFHDGGFIAFGPDDKLYITTGDAGDEQSAQDTSVLSGKILRINADGSIPGDNPFNNAVYSYGHRNPQGLAWDDRDRLWSSEHGPSGAQSGNDEINLIVKGGNYGWPVIRGQQTHQGMLNPVAESGLDDTWAPGAIIYLDGSLYFTGLRGQSLYKAAINEGETLDIKTHLRGEYGRLRAIMASSDGFIYMSTSNRDGRGNPETDDDKIIKINPNFLK